MKYILLLAGVFFVVHATAQNPDYFSNNPEWRVDNWVLSIGFPCEYRYRYIYYLNGDTVLTDSVETTYYKIFRRGTLSTISVYPDNSCDENTWVIDEYVALVRQVDRNVYIKSGNGPETLIYDFNLAVGDTIDTELFYPEQPLIVTFIDSIWVGDYYFKRFYSNQILYNGYLIEGIGHGMGFLEPNGWTDEWGAEMYCYVRGDSIVYTFENGEGGCDYVLSVEKHHQFNIGFTIYPNPAVGKVTIAVNENVKVVKVRVYGVMGRVVIEKSYQSPQPPSPRGSSIALDVRDLQPGMYLIEVETKDGLREIKRVVIE